MGRVTGGVIGGYVTMLVIVFALMTAAWMVLGAGGAFQPGSWEVSGLWIAVSIAVALGAAVAGGLVCAAIARHPRGPQALMVVVILLGVVFAIPLISGSGSAAAAGPRPDVLSMMDAMRQARQPVWIALLNPILGAIGVWIGARLKRGEAAA